MRKDIVDRIELNNQNIKKWQKAIKKANKHEKRLLWSWIRQGMSLNKILKAMLEE